MGEEGDVTLWATWRTTHPTAGPVTAFDHVHFTRSGGGRDTVCGLEDHDVLWNDGATATRGQLAALGVTFISIAQVSESGRIKQLKQHQDRRNDTQIVVRRDGPGVAIAMTNRENVIF